METHTQETHVEETHTENNNDWNNGNNGEKNDSLVVRFLVILGVIILLFFISVAIVRVVPKIFSSIGGAGTYFSSLFGGNKDLEVSTNAKEIASGDTFLLSWKNNTTDKVGAYSVNFDCTPGLQVLFDTRDGKKPVICNTTFPLPNTTSGFPFTVTSENTDKTDLGFTLSLWDIGTTTSASASSTSATSATKELLKVKGKITVLPKIVQTVNATSTASTTNTQNNGWYGSTMYPDATTTSSQNNTSATSTTYTKPATKTPIVYSGSPDLAIRLVSTGWVDGSGAYHVGTAVPPGSRVLVKFNVTNVGTAPTGVWTVSATLPSGDPYQRAFVSHTEPAIYPGVSFDLNIAFDNFDPALGNTTITLNDYKGINGSNNSISFPMLSQGYGY